MRIDEILNEEEFDVNQALTAHDQQLAAQGVPTEKRQFIRNYIKSKSTLIKDAASFTAASQEAQDAWDAAKQAQRDKGQDQKISQREPGRHADGTEKQRNQYTGPGKKKPRPGKVGKIPVPGEVKQGMDMAKKAGEYVNPFSD